MTHSLKWRKQALFWGGTALVFLGVALHLPMYVSTADMHFHMAHMAMGGTMAAGMGVLAVGLVLAGLGLFSKDDDTAVATTAAAAPKHIADPPSERLHANHWILVAVLIFAVAIDAQKPYTFTFILPEVAKEYGVSSPANPIPGAPAVGWLPFTGIVGTVLGSFIWGILGDKVGRRSALMFAAVLFVGTSICGAMPGFWWNAFMCFAMGLGAGGMLPAAYTLLAETMPAKSRGWLVVLVAGVGTALGFEIVAVLADVAMPHLSWRFLWLSGVASGAVLLGLSRFVPESPRFLLRHGREAEADTVLRRFGAPRPVLEAEPKDKIGIASLFAPPYTFITVGLVLCAAAWGVVTFGFLTWLPINLQKVDVDLATVNDVLARSALIALPVSVLVAWLYARWSSRFTMVGAAMVTSAVLAAFAVVGTSVGGSTTLMVLVVLLLIGCWAVTAVVTPYSTEVYPTTVRARGAAVVAGAGKLGGVLALAMTVSGIAPPSVAASAVYAMVPMVIGGLVLLAYAVETRSKALEAVVSNVTSGPTGRSVIKGGVR